MEPRAPQLERSRPLAVPADNSRKMMRKMMTKMMRKKMRKKMAPA
jgi:hypothetical protein